MDSGRIDQDDLRIVAIQDSLDAIARGLRLGRDNSDFLPDERIDQAQKDLRMLGRRAASLSRVGAIVAAGADDLVRLRDRGQQE